MVSFGDDTTGDVDTRESLLRMHQYGGQTDWRIVFHYKCENAGEQEMQIQKQLSQFQLIRMDGRGQESCELFSCSAAVAIDAAQQVIR